MPPVTLFDATGRPVQPATYGSPYGGAGVALAPQWTRPALPETAATAWTYAEAVQAAEHATYADLTPGEYATNQRLAERHDLWGDGADWMGPTGGDGTAWRLLKPEILRQFTPVDVLGEALGRFRNALLKREPSVSFVPVTPEGPDGQPSKAQAAEAAAARDAVSAWWDRVHLWRHARAALTRARWAGRGALRTGVHPAHAVPQPDGSRALPTGLPLAAAFARVLCTAPVPHEAAVVIDLATGQPAAVLRYVHTTGVGVAQQAVNVCEVWAPVVTGQGAAAQVSYVVRTVPERGVPTERPAPIDRLPVAEMAADLLLRDAARRQQQRVSFIESAVPRAAETSAFAERYLKDIEPAGVYVEGPPADGDDVVRVDTDEQGNIVSHVLRLPWTIGAGVVTHVNSRQTGAASEEGATPIADGEVIFKEPSDPEHLLKTARHARATLLQSMHQAHVLRPTDQQVSGYSQEQARADFTDDLELARGALEGMIRETIAGAFAWALAMADGTGPVRRDFLARFRVAVDLHVSAGPLTAAEQESVLARYREGLCSRENALALLGEEDVPAELGRLRSDPRAQLDHAQRLAEVLATYQTLGPAVREAARPALEAAGIDAALLDALLSGGVAVGEEDKTDDADDADRDAEAAVVQEALDVVAGQVTAIGTQVTALAASVAALAEREPPAPPAPITLQPIIQLPPPPLRPPAEVGEIIAAARAALPAPVVPPVAEA
jgi:hypothetical protein